MFALKVSEVENREWRAIVQQDEISRLNLIRNIEDGSEIILKSGDSVRMRLINIQTVKKQRSEIPFSADLIYWTDDLLLNSFKPQRGCCVIISGELKAILEKFSCYKYFIYPIEFLDSPVVTSKKTYFLLHIVGGYGDYLNFSKSKYEYYDSKNKIVLKTERGGFNSKTDFQEKNHSLFKESRIIIKIIESVVTKAYDIMWGIPNTLYVNEKVKKHIQEAEIIGVGFSPLMSPNIVIDAG